MQNLREKVMDEGAEGEAVGPGRCEVFDPDVLEKNCKKSNKIQIEFFTGLLA